jgi:nitrite reductase/ring-hydroxylating ferredoxin subunit
MRLAHPEQPSPAPDGLPLDEQPRWRRDFPIDWPHDEYVARRDLVKFVLLTSLAFVTGQFLLLGRHWLGRGAPAPAPQRIAAVSDVPPGGARVFEYPAGSSPRLLVRLADGRFVAYDQQCTHLQCPVLPHLEDGRLHCPCHNGWFDAATGRPTAGPPRRPLPRVTLELRDGAVYATGIVRETS